MLAQVRSLESVFEREKASKEAEDTERVDEAARLRPAIESLNELQAQFEGR